MSKDCFDFGEFPIDIDALASTLSQYLYEIGWIYSPSYSLFKKYSHSDIRGEIDFKIGYQEYRRKEGKEPREKNPLSLYNGFTMMGGATQLFKQNQGTSFSKNNLTWADALKISKPTALSIMKVYLTIDKVVILETDGWTLSPQGTSPKSKMEKIINKMRALL